MNDSIQVYEDQQEIIDTLLAAAESAMESWDASNGRTIPCLVADNLRAAITKAQQS